MTFRNEPKTVPTHVIIPLGMLLSELNHGLSVHAFMALAKKENKTFDLQKVLPLILAEDRKFKAGGKDGLTQAQFIVKLREIFALTAATDDEMCQAWNAMLGDLSKLDETIRNLVTQHADKQLILMSGTNLFSRTRRMAVILPAAAMAQLQAVEPNGTPPRTPSP